MFIAFALMVAISGYFVSTTLLRTSSTAVTVALEETDKTISAYLREPRVAFDNIYTAIQDILDRNESQDVVRQYLNQTSEMLTLQEDGIKGFIDVYGYIRNEFISGNNWAPGDDFIPQQRPWYQLAVRSENMEYTAPYIDLMTGYPIISLAREIYGINGDYYGVLALDISIEWLFGYTESLQFVDGGYGMIVSQYLHIIAHPKEQFRSSHLQDLGGDYAAITDKLRVSRGVSYERIRDTGGSKAIVYFRQLYNGWYVGVVMPAYSYYADLYRNIFFLAALGFALAYGLSYILIRLAKDKLRSQEESRSKSSFLAMMSHEMRTPMNAIIGMTNIAKATGDAERKDYALEKIEDASNHLLGVINNILDMSKIEADKLELHPVAFDFREMVDNVIGIINFRVTEKQQILETDIDDEIPQFLSCDDQRLAQILTNLLSNAVKFTPEHGSIRLSAHVAERDGNMLMIRFDVEDTGVGISPEQLAGLFKPFQQADSATSRKYGGTWLGLTIAKRIVESMEGAISVTSEPGTGSNFTFSIKAEPADKPEIADGADSGEPVGDGDFLGYGALLAEDLDINREIVIALLEHTGLMIDCAENGAEAVRMFKEQPYAYNIIFMDLQMPVMDGFEATRVIRAQSAPNAKTVPIIAMTANVFKEDIDNCVKAGMNGHIGKPIDIDLLMQILAQYLRQQSPSHDRRRGDRRKNEPDRRQTDRRSDFPSEQEAI